MTNMFLYLFFPTFHIYLMISFATLVECKKICIFDWRVNVNVCVQTCLFERPSHVVYEHNALNAKAH